MNYKDDQPADPVAAYRVSYEVQLRAEQANDMDTASQARVECASLHGQMDVGQRLKLENIRSEVQQAVGSGGRTQ
jgi:hypothetical protein